MGRSYKKNPVVNYVGQSQKRGKQMCNRMFRRISKATLWSDKLLPVRPREILNEWDLGGDGKHRILPTEDYYIQSFRK